jgi:hypothetical protein
MELSKKEYALKKELLTLQGERQKKAVESTVGWTVLEQIRNKIE